MSSDRLAPDSERRLVLKFFGITESEITHLKALEPDEARWRIHHEFKAQIGWTERRRDFLLGEVHVEPTPPRPPTTRTAAPRNTKVTHIRGERLA